MEDYRALLHYLRFLAARRCSLFIVGVAGAAAGAAGAAAGAAGAAAGAAGAAAGAAGAGRGAGAAGGAPMPFR